MAIPVLNQPFVGGYISDSGDFYQLAYYQALYAADQAALPPEGGAVAPTFLAPRYWQCQFSDGFNIVSVRVICPLPFSRVANADRQVLTTSDGVDLVVTGRVGEAYTPYDQ